MQKSYLLKTLIGGGEVSLAVLDTTAVVNEAISRHALTPVAAAAFGRTLTACAYLCGWLKDETSAVSVTVKGDGAGGKVSVVGDGLMRMRGFVEENVHLPLREDGKLDVGGFIGRKGTLTVIRDDGTGVPFVGTSELVSGEIAEDFAAYFTVSEQRPTAVALGVKIAPDGHCLGAGGVFLQPLPGASEEAFALCDRLTSSLSGLSSQIEAQGGRGVFASLQGEGGEEREIVFRCHCSRRRAEGAVLSLGKEEAEALLDELGEIKVHCHYCNSEYTFTREETRSLFEEKDG